MNTQDKNYLLLVLSRLTFNPTPISYRIEGQETAYIGVQTNEAVTKYLVDYLNRQNMKLDKVIMLCTEEVRNDKILVQGKEQTTLKYYKNAIYEFLAQSGRYDSNTIPEDLFEVISYSTANYEVNEVLKPLDEIMRITEDREEASRKHLYVDFTGGPRSAALTLVFTCRILQRCGVAVEKILYSNIISSNLERVGKIEECTKVYSVFAGLEAAEAFDHGNIRKMIEVMEKEGNKEITDSLKNFERGMAKREEAIQMNQMEAMLDASKEVIKAADAIYQGDPLGKALISGPISDQKKVSQKLVENSKYREWIRVEELLKSNEGGKALNIFREKAIRILIEFGIIEDKPEKQNYENILTNEFMAAYCYYETPMESKISQKNGTRKKTFMDAVWDYVKLLGDNTERDPLDILHERNRSFYSLKKYMAEIPANKLPKGFAHNNFSQRICNEKIFRDLYQDDTENADAGRLIKQYQKLDRIYMGYGFPFACTYAAWFFEEYEKLYIDNMEYGAKSLQSFLNGGVDGRMKKALACFPEESFTYRTLIQKLQEERYEKMLHVIFPFQLSITNIHPVAIKGEKWEEFAYEFAKSFYSLKHVRNNVEHSGNMNSSDFEKAIQTLKRVLGQIKEIGDERNR